MIKILLITAILSLIISGCATHKNCGTAHYSTMTSQDVENMKQRIAIEYFLLNMGR